MVSTQMFASSSRFVTIARRSAAALALGAILGSHLIAPGSALAGGCGACDDDYDGLTNYEEYTYYGTDLANADSDFDGVTDYDELFFYYTNPLVPDQRVVGGGSTSSPSYDYDGDGLSDYDEQSLYGTSAERADTDGDGLNDGDEVIYYGTSPLYADSDGDGYGDGFELAHSMDPLFFNPVGP